MRRAARTLEHALAYGAVERVNLHVLAAGEVADQCTVQLNDR
jgi:hypothetical protein